MSLSGVFRWMARKPVVVVAGVLTVGFVAFFAVAGKRQAGVPGIIHLEFAFFKSRFSTIVEQWEKHGLLQSHRIGLWVDLFFPFAYAVCLTGVLGLLTLKPAEEPGTGLLVLLMIPLIGGVCDWIENGLHLFLLSDTSWLSEVAIFTAATAASLKWLLIVVSVVAILCRPFRRVFA
jgi:hypothetical protein